MQGRGFEPLKAEPAGLQPAPFGHSGTPARLRSVARPPQAVTTSRATRARLPTVALLAQLVEHLHGKEGVAGSSPAEGFANFLLIGVSRSVRLANNPVCGGYGAVYGAFRIARTLISLQSWQQEVRVECCPGNPVEQWG